MIRRKHFGALIMLLAEGLLAAGCAETSPTVRDTVIGAGVGTSAVAGLGAAIGTVVGSPWQGAAIGGAAGSIVGGSVGYAESQRKQSARYRGSNQPPVPDNVQTVGAPRWTGDAWVLYDAYGNLIWWNESKQRWQYGTPQYQRY